MHSCDKRHSNVRCDKQGKLGVGFVETRYYLYNYSINLKLLENC